MRKKIIYSAFLLLFGSCGIFKSVTSNTIIQPQESFVLGNNEHGKFSVRLRNVSAEDLIIHRSPIAGGRHSFVTVQPNKTVHVNVEMNTALVIENRNNSTASVNLVIKGDTGLGMGYSR